MPATRSRNTRQLDAIRAAFDRARRPLSPLEALDLAQRDVDGLGIATVYRAIRTLVDEAWLTAVDLPGGAVLYERSGKAHHHHFQCESCGRVYELDGCLPAIHNLAAPGFTVHRHELTLYGNCASCAAPPCYPTNRRRPSKGE